MGKAYATMTNLPRKQIEIDCLVDTAGPLVMLLPTSMRGSAYALDRMPPGVRFLGCYMLNETQAEIAVREMLSRGMAVKLDGNRIYHN
jgi:hypothetical protein